MSVRIGKILPPAVAPIGFRDIWRGILAMRPASGAATAFSQSLREYFQVKHCYLLSSGKASLALILQALKELYPEKDEVLIPAFTCYSVPASIFRLGLKLRICDMEPDTLDFDYQELARQISAPRLLCVIPTHLFGVTADIDRVRQTIGNRDIPIVEDAAQVMGGKRWGHKAGTMGDVGFFSLERGKAFSTVKGGIIVTNSDKIGGVLKRRVDAVPASSLAEQGVLAMYGVALAVFSRPWLYWIPRSLPFLGLGETIFAPEFPIKRLSGFQAGMAAGWQNRLQENMRLRARNSAYLRMAGIRQSCPREALFSGPLRYPVLAADKAEKTAILQESHRLGLGGADIYPTTVDNIARLKSSIVDASSKKAQTMIERMFTLPVHPQVTETHLQKIVGLMKSPAGMAGEAGMGGLGDLAATTKDEGGRNR